MEQIDEADENTEMAGKEDDFVNIEEDADSDVDIESQAAAATKKKVPNDHYLSYMTPGSHPRERERKMKKV